jgi:hypothetical protein
MPPKGLRLFIIIGQRHTTKAALEQQQYCRIINKATNKRFNSDSFVRKRHTASRVNLQGPPIVAITTTCRFVAAGADGRLRLMVQRRRCRLPLAAAACSSLVEVQAGGRDGKQQHRDGLRYPCGGGDVMLCCEKKTIAAYTVVGYRSYRNGGWR